MKREENFVSYDLALKLKEIGFNEECFAVYYDGIYHEHSIQNEYLKENNECSAPLYQQAFDFFRNKYNIDANIYRSFSMNNSYHFSIVINNNYDDEFQQEVVQNRSYEQARKDCLQKIIEIHETIESK